MFSEIGSIVYYDTSLDALYNKERVWKGINVH